MLNETKFTDAQAAYYLRRRKETANDEGLGDTYLIFSEMSANNTAEQHGFEVWTITYDDFVKRIPQITSDQIKQAETNQIATAEGRLSFLHELGKSKDLKTLDRLRLFEMMKREQAEIDEHKMASGESLPSGKILIANPKEVDLDAALISELILTMRHDFGGIENCIEWKMLELHELRALRGVIDDLVAKREEALQATGIVDAYEEEDD